MKYILKIVFLFIIAFYISLFSNKVYAASEFATAYNIEYTVDTKGTTTTRQHITLTNLLEHVYATEYSIIIGSTAISDVAASDNFGTLTPDINIETNATKINLKFDKHIIGKDKKRNVTVSYKSPDFATVKGQVLEVGFPLLANSGDMVDYQVTINIPNSFGKATHIIPIPSDSTKNDSFTSYTFNQSSIKDQDSISATFGTAQIYKFTLKYNLENPNSVKGQTEIALPPDTNYQQVIFTSIDPKPDQVTVDMDGNWLAKYVLEPNSKMQVIASGNIKLSYFPKPEFANDLTDEEIKIYTQPQQFWEADNKTIQDIAKTDSSPKQIYDYIVNNFEYDYNRLNNNATRLGAVKALENPDKNICMEFTDSFIALARAAGIPARELNGYAYTENDKLRPLSLEQDVLHSWPQYYDKNTKQWIEVDPTWGKTTGGLNFFDKFDLDHIAFVIHGSDSTYPITAGSYKYNGQKSKDVEISFDSNWQPFSSKDITIQTPAKGITGLALLGFAKIYNTGSSALYDIPYNIRLIHNGNNLIQNENQIKILPPFGYFQVPLSYQSSWKDRGGIYAFKIESESIKKETNFELKPVLNYKLIASGVSFIFLSLALSIIIAKLRRKKLTNNHKKTIYNTPENIIQPDIINKSK